MRFLLGECCTVPVSPEENAPRKSFFPYRCLNFVFVENSYATVNSVASMIICRSFILHPQDIPDQAYETRRLLVEAITMQWFGTYIVPQSWSDYWLVPGLSIYLSILCVAALLGKNEARWRIKEVMQLFVVMNYVAVYERKIYLLIICGTNRILTDVLRKMFSVIHFSDSIEDYLLS